MDVSALELSGNNYTGGLWAEGDGEILQVQHKYDQTLLHSFRTYTDVESIVQSSLRGHEILKNLSAGEKRELLEKFLDVFKGHCDQLVELVIAEAGKPRDYAASEVSRCLSTIQDAIEQATAMGGEVVPMDFSIGEGKSAFTMLKPAGVVLAISPFNFPLNLALHKIMPAIAAGCPVILRPSPFTPLCALMLAKVAEEAKWPGDIFQVVNTPITETQQLVEDKRIRVLSFTGSDTVGWLLRDLAHQKKVLLELGGNAAVYVDEGCDITQIVPQLVKGAYLFAGQICISTQRIYAHHSCFDSLKEALITEVSKIKVGDPTRAENLCGPVIDRKALERIYRWIQEDVAQGAKLLCGGKVLDREKNLYAPTLLSQTSCHMNIHKKEAFAPVASIDQVKDHEEALDLINNTVYGLQAGIFTNKINVMKDAFRQLDVGGVLINSVPGYRMDHMPYGGVKSSGMGREGAKYAMEAYLEPTLCIIS